MSHSTAPTSRAREEAADWFARLNKRDVPATDLEAFRLWRKAPGHKEAYDEVDALWRTSAALAQDEDIQSAVGDALARLNKTSTKPASGSRRAIIGFAFPAALLTAAGLGGYALLGPTSYATDVGEQRVVQLDDGSSVKLDTHSKVTVRYSRGRRDLTLERGQALFDVAHDAARPFVVRAGMTTVTALGTRFDVRREAEGAKVTLVQGSVEVQSRAPNARASWRLTPGQMVSSHTSNAKPQNVDVAAATSWSIGRLVFQAVPLGDAIAEVNRYSHDKVVLEASNLTSEPISGVFNTGDTGTFVDTVADYHDLVADRSVAGTVRLVRATGPDHP